MNCLEITLTKEEEDVVATDSFNNFRGRFDDYFHAKLILRCALSPDYDVINFYCE